MKNLKSKISHFKREEILKRLISQDSIDAKNIKTESKNEPSQPEHKNAISQSLSKRVKRDIARIVFLAALSVLIIFGLYFADKQTGILIKSAQKITQLLHI